MKDFIGQVLEEGDYVAGLYSENTTPSIFKIISFTPKKVKILALTDGDDVKEASSKFPKDLIKVEAALVSKLIHEDPKDNLGVDLFVGDYVYGSQGGYINPVIFEILSFVPRGAKLKPLISDYNVWDDVRFTHDLIKVDPRLVTMGILQRKNDDG